MRSSSGSIGFNVFLLAVVVYYLAISVGIDLCHDHDPDFEFHDNCPACQWLALHQDDFSQAGQILNVLNDPLFLVGYERYVQSLVIPSEGSRISFLSRAPPAPV